MTHSATADLEVFESHRPLLVAHAYRMLGDLGRAEDMVQEAWLRWDGRRGDVEVAVPRAYLVTLVTRLCLNELDSVKTRREESRSNCLPEPMDLNDRAEMLDQVSMAFLVVLQRCFATSSISITTRSPRSSRRKRAARSWTQEYTRSMTSRRSS